jgi:hypothetical protein
MNSTNQSAVVVPVDGQHVKGLAFDWIHRNLYWTNVNTRSIEVASLAAVNGETVVWWHRTLIQMDLHAEPHSIVVDPRAGNRMLYWTDCGSAPKIERAYLDGSALPHASIISHDVACPSGLTIDYDTDLLFWVDMKLHIIASLDMNTLTPNVILTSFSLLQQPTAVSSLGDYLYWADIQSETIFSMTKLRNGSGSGVGRSSSSSASRIISNLKLLTDVDVLHRLRQPLSSNACAQRHCSHICLPKLRYPGFICTCPNNDTRMTYTLHSDGRTCIVTHINVPDQSDGSDVFPSSLTNSNVQVPPDASVKRENGGDGIGRIVGIVIGTLIGTLLLSVAFCWLACQYRRRNIKSLKFDNPVYRTKAAEDQFTISSESLRPSTVFPASSEPLTSSSTECIVTAEQF